MELTSIVRRIDDLGRFVLPVDIRRKLNINPGDSLEMSFSSDSIQLKKISSIQNLIPLAQLIIKTLYLEYNILCAVESENKILYSVKKKKEDSHSFPIISNDNMSKIILESGFGENIKILTEKLMEQNLEL